MDTTKVLREIGTELVNLASDRGLTDAIAKLAETHPDRRAIAQAVIPGIVETIVKQAQTTTEEQPVILSAEIDEPQIIGGAEFIPLYPEMCEEISEHVPEHWDVEDDALYYHDSDGSVVIYNDDIEQVSFAGRELGVAFYDGRWIISSEDLGEEHLGYYETITEMIEALS